MTNSAVKPLYDSPDLAYIDKGTPLQKNIPTHISEIHKHVSSLSNSPHHSHVDELLGIKGTWDVYFEPPPGQSANDCFRSSILPSLKEASLKIVSQENILSFQIELEKLEKIFTEIKNYKLRFCKG